jgi:hypothetical protein
MRRTGPDRSVEASREAVSLTFDVNKFIWGYTDKDSDSERTDHIDGRTWHRDDNRDRRAKMSGISAQIRVKAGLTAVARMRSGNSLGK